jgi:hypothetical protein
MASSGLTTARARMVLAALACASGLALYIWIAANGTGFGVDFNQFYSASRLAGTGRLYDWDALRKIEAEHGPPVHTGRLPVVAFGVKLVGWMPYHTAHAVWVAGSIVALLVFNLVWPGLNRPLTAIAVCWSAPAAALLGLGQDTPFWLMFAAIGLLCLSRGRPCLAGAVFALCICKYHLAIGIPILLVAQKRWNALLAGAAAVAFLLGASFWIEGPTWPRSYLAQFADPLFSPAPQRMANLLGIAWWLPWPGAVEIVLAIAVACLLWIFLRRTTDLGLAGAGAAAAGLLLARHGYAGDCALLIPLLVLTVQRPAVPVWLQCWAVLLLTPVPFMLVVLVQHRQFYGQLLIVGFVVAALLHECLVERPAHDPSALPA